MRKSSTFLLEVICTGIVILILTSYALSQDKVVVVPLNSGKVISSGSLYAKVAVVAQRGGDYTNPLDAMNDISSWCGIAGESNPCLLRIMPGIYDLGINGLQMLEYVDIEGSGKNTTIITSNHSSGVKDATAATLAGASNAEVRFLTVKNGGGSTYTIAMYNSGASPAITNVTLESSGGSENYGIYNKLSSHPKITNVTSNAAGAFQSYGVFNSFSSPVITNLTVTAAGAFKSCGVYNYESDPEMNTVQLIASGGSNYNFGMENENSDLSHLTNIRVEASGGSQNYGIWNSVGSLVRVNNSSIYGETYSIFNDIETLSSGVVYVGSSLLDGGVYAIHAYCVGSYNKYYQALDEYCHLIP